MKGQSLQAALKWLGGKYVYKEIKQTRQNAKTSESRGIANRDFMYYSCNSLKCVKIFKIKTCTCKKKWIYKLERKLGWMNNIE